MSFYPTYTDVYSRAIANIEYHYGRESSQYLRYLEALNKHIEYLNKTKINNLLHFFGVKSVRGYYYRTFAKLNDVDIYNQPFEYWVSNGVSLIFPFQLLYKNIGEYQKFDFSELGVYNRTIIKPSLDTSFEFSPNKSFLKDYSEDLEIYEPSQNFPDDREILVLYPFISSEIFFDFGSFISLPTYSYYELEQSKHKINDYWKDGIHIIEYEYFDRHTFRSFDSTLNVENQFLFFKPNPNFDYENYLEQINKWKYVISNPTFPKISKCCLFDIFNKTKKI